MYKVKLHDGRVKEFAKKNVAESYAEATQGVLVKKAVKAKKTKKTK